MKAYYLPLFLMSNIISEKYYDFMEINIFVNKFAISKSLSTDAFDRTEQL